MYVELKGILETITLLTEVWAMPVKSDYSLHLQQIQS